jgi:hypothetical protein
MQGKGGGITVSLLTIEAGDGIGPGIGGTFTGLALINQGGGCSAAVRTHEQQLRRDKSAVTAHVSCDS